MCRNHLTPSVSRPLNRRASLSRQLDSSDRLKFDDVLEQLLKGLEPSCLEEQNFCVGFFKLGADMTQSQVGYFTRRALAAVVLRMSACYGYGIKFN